MPVALLAIALLAAPPSAGSWTPTPGPGGEGAVFALAMGGDGALYAAGGGLVYRRAPEAEWTVAGRYAPELRWSLGEEDIEEAAEGHQLDDEETFDEDLVSTLLTAYVEEADARPDSAYFVAGLVTSTRGVWLGTGGGLFWVDAKGVTGPVGDLTGIRALTATSDGLVVATEDTLHRVDATGAARAWRRARVDHLTTFNGRVAYVADGVLWRDDGGPTPLRLSPPTGNPRRVVGAGASLFVATGLAVYRHRAGEWKICPTVPETPTRIWSDGERVAVVTEQAIYSGDAGCDALTRYSVPWPGGMRFTDAGYFDDRLWAASSEGVFVWQTDDDVAHTRLQVDGFKRALRRMPPFDQIAAEAMRYQRIDAETTSFGARPTWRILLPELRLRGVVRPERVEQTPTTLDGSERLTTLPPRFDLEIYAQWTLHFDGLAALFDPLDSDDGETALLDEVDESSVGLEYEGDELFDDSGEPVEVVFVDLDTEAEFDSASYAYERAARERRLLQRDRTQLIERMRRLYRERIRVLYRVWIEDEGDEAALKAIVRLDEIDALLDAYSGGAFGRRMQ
jgi:hypothetical protein